MQYFNLIVALGTKDNLCTGQILIFCISVDSFMQCTVRITWWVDFIFAVGWYISLELELYLACKEKSAANLTIEIVGTASTAGGCNGTFILGG